MENRFNKPQPETVDTSIGGQLKAKGVDLKLVVDKDRGITPETTESKTKAEDKASRESLLKEARKRLEKDEKRLQKEVTEAVSARSVFVENIANIQNLLKKEGVKDKKRLETLLSQAQDHLRLVDNIFPKEASSVEYDEKVFRNIVAKFKDYEHARRAQTIAAIKLNEGKGSVGDVTRAQNEAHQLHQEITALAKQGEQIIENKTPNPVRDEGVTYTHEQAIKDAEERARRPKRVAPGVLGQEEELKVMQQDMNALVEQTETAPEGTTISPDTQGTEAAQTILAEREKLASAPAQETEPAQTTALEVAPHMELVSVEAPEVENTSEIPVGTPWQGQEEAFAKFESMAEATPASQEAAPLSIEAQIEQKRNALALTDKNVQDRFEKIGMTEKFFRMAERFNEFKKEHKYAYTGLMILAGVGSLATGTALAGGTVGATTAALRFITGVGVFYTKEKQYAREAEEAGIERTKVERGGDRLKAAAWGVVMGGLLSYVLGESAHYVGEKAADIWGGHEAMSHAIKAATAHASTEAASIAAVGETTVSPSEISLGQANLAALEHAGSAVAPEMVTDYVATAESGDSVWSLAQEQLKAHYGDKFTNLSEAQQTYLIDTIKDKISADPEHFGIESGDANMLAVGDEVNFKEIFENKDFMDSQFTDAQDLSSEEVANIEQPAEKPEVPVETPTRIVSTEEIMNHYYQPSMPQEIVPSDPQVLAYADQQVHDHINSLFGSKGFFGFGAQDGMNAISWKDPEVGFANKTVEQIMNAKPSAFPEDGALHFGIEDYSATEKMKGYIDLAREETGVPPHPGENVLEYVKRAEASAISKFMNKG